MPILFMDIGKLAYGSQLLQEQGWIQVSVPRHSYLTSFSNPIFRALLSTYGLELQRQK